MVAKLKAIATTHRLVFVGFGFKDKDFTYVLKAVGRLAHSGRPSFAFIGYECEPTEAREHQDNFLENYNVEVIPYSKQDGNHAGLQRVLEGPRTVVANLLLRRSGHLGMYFHRTNNPERLVDDCRQAVA